MKTKIKRHSRSVLSVVLAISMLVSCMMVGLIATDAANVTDEALGGSDDTITDYLFKGSFDSWTNHKVNSEGKAFIDINTAGVYEFVVVTGGGTQRRANKNFTESGSYNTSEDNTNFTITVTTPGTYTFQTSLKNSGGSVTVTVTFPSGGSTTNDWKLLDGSTWSPSSSTKNFTMNSSTGYYEYTQRFTAADNYFRVSNGNTVYRGSVDGNTTITAGGDWDNLATYEGSGDKAYKFTPSTTGNYIVQIDATNLKLRIRAATQYTVTCTTPTNGTLTASPASNYEGNNVVITATPNTNYTLKQLIVNYDDTDHDVTSQVVNNQYTLTMPAFNVTARAVFTNSKTIYFNNYVTKWPKIYVYTKNSSNEEGNGPSPGQEMTRLGQSSIYEIEIPADSNYIVFTGSGGTNNLGGTIKCGSNEDFGNAVPTGSYNEYKATNTETGTSSTGEWSAHQGRTNVYTVTPGTSVTGNSDLYYKGLSATLYDYYTDGEYNGGTSNWINGIADYNNTAHSAEYSRDDGSQYKWNPYKTFDTALSKYARANSVTYPLYFGNLNVTNGSSSEGWIEYESDNSTTLYNWSRKINNSVELKPNGASVTGLAANAESNSTINHSSGSAMVMFDEDWLSRENSTGNPLATILHSTGFPVRKISNTAYTVTNVYLDIGTWAENTNNIRYAAYFFKSSDNTQYTWKDLTASGSYYTCEIPSGYDKVIFCRMKGDQSTNSWDNRHNQTGNLTVPNNTNNVLYTVDGWDSSDDTHWSTGTGITVASTSYDYYEYDSTNGTDNAYIQNVNTGAQTATIEYSTSDKVYSATAGSGTVSSAGFYPFDNMTGNITNQNTGTSNRAHDLGFGMKLEIPFSINANGTIDGTAAGLAQTFNFSGDDDLWVYIDGNLVLDLGGAHKKAEGTIDFKNRTATSTTKVVDAATAKATADGTDLTATETESNTFTWFNNTNPDVLHTMTLYYMERGMYDSNLKFDFSFHAISNLYSTEKKVRTWDVNSGFYDKTAQTIYDPYSSITKFERSYQEEEFSFDHKRSGTESGTYDYPEDGFTYSKDVVNWSTTTGRTTDTTSESYTAGGALTYDLCNDEKANFIGKFTSGDYFDITETPSTSNKYNYTPRLTVYNDNDSTHRTTYPVTDLGSGEYRFEFDEPDSTGLKTVNVRAQFENVMKTHDLKITKSIGDIEDTTTEFTFYIAFNFDNDGSPTGYIPYRLYGSSDMAGNTSISSTGQINDYGMFKLRAGETITFNGIPEGADFRIYEETSGLTQYAYDKMSVIGTAATAVDVGSTGHGATMTMGASDVNVTAINADNTVKATIRVKYAPSYYDFEQGTNISTDEYKNDGGVRNHISQNVQCETDFTDEAKTTTVISQFTTVETATRDASKTFDVKVSKPNAGGKLFIGWYDGDGNRYNDTDATQHSFTASASKAQDRIFEARFITAPTYRVDFDAPTRLWGNRIYKVFGKVDNSMITSGFIGYDSSRETTASVEKRYYLTGDFIQAKKPSETIFLQNITWPNVDDGKTDTQYGVSKTVTHNSSGDVETSTGDVTYDLYRSVAATVTDRKVSVDFYNDCSHLDTRTSQYTVDYGSSVNDNETVAINIPEGKTFYRWKIETLNSLGGTTLTPNGVLITYDYSPNFNYVAYDNYKVTAELLDKDDSGKEYSPYTASNPDDPYHEYAPTNDTSVINLGQTRSHWNDTTDGVPYTGESESDKYRNANYDYDRLFIDLALSYSDGSETKLNTLDDCVVGFIIQYKADEENWVEFKTVNFSSKELGDKNRIEYYYGFLNAAGNRNAQFRVQPTINRVASGAALEFDFKADQFSAQT